MVKNNKCSEERIKQISDALDERSSRMSIDFDSHIDALGEEIENLKGDAVHWQVVAVKTKEELKEMTECAEKNGRVVDEEREISYKLAHEREQLKLEIAGFIKSIYSWKEQALYQQELVNNLEEERDRLREALKAITIDAIKCEECGEPPQYFITQWSMDKISALIGDK